MTILELREKRNKAWEAAKAFLDSHRRENGTLSAEDDAVYTKMEAEITDLGREISRLERQEAFAAELNKPLSKPITSKPEATAKNEETTGRKSEAYKTAFWNHARMKVTPEIANALQVGVDSEGGFLVPDEFENTLIEALSDGNVVRSISHQFTTNSGAHKIPIVTSKGIANWVDEEGTINESDDSFSQQLIGAHKVATLIKVSTELLNDSAFNLEQYFTREFTRRIGAAEENAFINGNGTSKPTGILNATGGAEVGVTTANATAITADELIDLFFSLKAPYRKNAVWLLNDSTMKHIRKLKDGNGQYLWQPSLHESGFDTILGKRIYTSAYVPDVAAGAKTVAFGDFGFYWIGDRQGITFQRLNELYATNGQIGFLASKRVDGKLILPEAVKVLQQKA
jgi:HK97 family phage major capsid protein